VTGDGKAYCGTFNDTTRTLATADLRCDPDALRAFALACQAEPAPARSQNAPSEERRTIEIATMRLSSSGASARGRSLAFS